MIATLGAVLGQEPAADRGASALARYEAALEDAEREYLEARLEAHDACLEGLRDAKRDLLRAGDLSGALRLEKVERGFRKERTRDRARLQFLEPAARFATHGYGFERKALRSEANAFSNRRYV